jgi:MFS family permease
MKTAHMPTGPAPGEGGLLENQAVQLPRPSGALTREILVSAVVVVLGAIMTILYATIVNVALPSLGRDLHASIPVIQWVPTVYLLAFAAGIGKAAALTPSSPHAADAIAGAFAVSFAVALEITVLALVPAVLPPGRPASPPATRGTPEKGHFHG